MRFINPGLRRINGSATVSVLRDRLSAFVIRPVTDSRAYLHAAGKVRRFCLAHFRKEYVRQQRLARQGGCRQCGFCCNMLFTCPLLTREGGCVSYGACRPLVCRVFPIDQRDVDEVSKCGGRCGYRFEDRR
ncbi:MAG: uncharacterized protein PWQ57_3076 [Desulfovibrionales bacterium]|nr:uncharacterized protein [Desulfovibrionales bacterium]